jgi:hypothetical protein
MAERGRRRKRERRRKGTKNGTERVLAAGRGAALQQSVSAGARVVVVFQRY